jgi:ferredoxin-NADP reductase
MIKNAFKLELVNTQMISPSVRHMIFKRVDTQPFHFIPGQFITLHFYMDGVLYNRSYSIATIPHQPSEMIEIAVSPFVGGPGTKFLFNMQPGDEVDTTGPFGRLVLRDDEHPKRFVLVATGTGVTPYRSMLPALLQRLQAEEDLQVTILMGVQKHADLLYAEDFLAYAAQHPRLEFHAFYSREAPETIRNHEHTGYVQTAFEWLNMNPTEDIVYLCGNPNMIDQSFAFLMEKGFETKHVRREKYISPRRPGVPADNL